MLPVNSKLDTREYAAAYREYVGVRVKEDFAYLANRQSLNLALKVGRRTPIGSKEKLRRLEEREWWPKFVAKQIREGGVRVKTGGSTKKGNAKYKKVSGKYSVADARRASKRLIEKRINKIGFIRSGWLPAIRMFTALKFKTRGNPNLAGTKNIRRPKGAARVAKPGVNPTALIINHSKGAERVGLRAMQEGMNEAAADMRGFCRERCSETARRFNAKR